MSGKQFRTFRFSVAEHRAASKEGRRQKTQPHHCHAFYASQLPWSHVISWCVVVVVVVGVEDSNSSLVNTGTAGGQRPDKSCNSSCPSKYCAPPVICLRMGRPHTSHPLEVNLSSRRTIPMSPPGLEGSFNYFQQDIVYNPHLQPLPAGGSGSGNNHNGLC